MPIRYRDLSEDELKSLVYEIMGDTRKDVFEDGNDLDFSYAPKDDERYRLNVFRKACGVGAVIRVIPKTIPSLDGLGLPPIVKTLAQVPRGLVLVTGPTGSGKSTTLASIIDFLNSTEKLNIITLEDPVEYVHKSKSSLVVQRELGSSVGSFADGLRAALREDPDVILVGEMRDAETIMTAMIAAETGHLVLGTMHTMSAVKTLDRIIDVLPHEQKAQGTMFLAKTLVGVISQALVRTADGRARKAILEIMVMTPAISNLLLSNKAIQIPAAIQTGRQYGMQLMDQALLESVQAKEIDPDVAYQYAQDKLLFQRFVTNPKLLPQMSLVGR